MAIVSTANFGAPGAASSPTARALRNRTHAGERRPPPPPRLRVHFSRLRYSRRAASAANSTAKACGARSNTAVSALRSTTASSSRDVGASSRECESRPREPRTPAPRDTSSTPVQHHRRVAVSGGGQEGRQRRGGEVGEEGGAAFRHRGGGAERHHFSARPRRGFDDGAHRPREITAGGAVRDSSEGEVEIHAEPALVGGADRGDPAGEALHRGNLPAREIPRKHLGGRRRRVAQKIQLTRGRARERRAGTHRGDRERFGVRGGAREHAHERFERASVREGETLVVEVRHRRLPINPGKPLADGVHGVVVVPRRRRRRGRGRRADPRGGRERRERLSARRRVQRRVRARERRHQFRQLRLIHSRRESQHRREILLRGRASVPELLDHAGRARGETPDDVAGRHLAPSRRRRASLFAEKRREISRRRTPSSVTSRASRSRNADAARLRFSPRRSPAEATCARTARATSGGRSPRGARRARRVEVSREGRLRVGASGV